MNEAVLLEVNDGVAILRLNRPEKLNAVNHDLRQAMLGHINAIESDPEIRAVLLTGQGRSFCSGADQSGPKVERTPAAIRRRLAEHHEVVVRLWNLTKPVVCAVRGSVVGIGWSYALCSDVLYASDTSQFWQPLIARGGIPDGGALWLMARHTGAFQAQDIVYSCRKVSSQEAKQLGLVTETVEDARLESVAMDRARHLASMPTLAIELCKRLMHSNSTCLEEYLDKELGHIPLANMAR